MKEIDGYYFDCLPKFRREYKKFIKTHKCPSLKEDFELFMLNLIDDFNMDELPSIYHRISGLKSYVTEPAFIVKDFRCHKINKGKKSCFRITFLLINGNKFLFTEIYHKQSKDIEDKDRINSLFLN